MNPSARIQGTLELLTEIAAAPRPADSITSAYFRNRRYIGSKDRAEISTRLYAVLRHHARVGWWLQKFHVAEAPRARMLVYLTLVEGIPEETVKELFSGGKFAPEELDENERKFLHKLSTRTLEHPNMPEEVRGECPDWAATSLKARFGINFMHEMEALLAPAPLDLRVNSLKATRDEILVALKKIGCKAVAGKLSPYSIRIADRPSLSALPMLKNGEVEIQDEGSQLVALMVDAQPGQRVVDFCAGAGGKTLAIAAAMKNKGRIIACDVLTNRLKRSTERFRRAGLHNIEVKPLTSESDPWVKRHKASFDRVLVDAPCSGTGTWRRNPDSRWNMLAPNLENLTGLQGKILASAARLVKPGGRLIYATCSLLPEENEEQVEKFLAAHPDFTVLPFETVVADKLPSTHAQYLALTPARHRTDGFFAAVMERKAAPNQDKIVPDAI